MSQLPEEVVRFLLDNPDEVAKLKSHIDAVESNRVWRAQLAEKRNNAKMVPCGTYGCTVPRNEMDIMCKDCLKEYREDPDAFK